MHQASDFHAWDHRCPGPEKCALSYLHTSTKDSTWAKMYKIADHTIMIDLRRQY